MKWFCVMWKMSFVVMTQREFLPIWVPPISFLGCFCHYLDFWMTIVHIVIVFKIFISSIQVTFTDDLHSIYWPSTALQKSVKSVSREKTIIKTLMNDGYFKAVLTILCRTNILFLPWSTIHWVRKCFLTQDSNLTRREGLYNAFICTYMPPFASQ